MQQQTRPEWANGRQPDEYLFCQEFLMHHDLLCANGKFYNKDGLIRDEAALRKQIYDMVKQFYSSGLQKKVDALLAALRLETQVRGIGISECKVHVQNGTYDVFDGFSEEKIYCRHRLPVEHDANANPTLWLQFLDQLLEKDDILTLQEFMGYCLLPTTKAQKMLIIIGDGGEGKSRIGVVMKAIFGEHMHMGSLAKVESDRFARADLENVLVMVDDDMRLEALNSTNHIKSIITADVDMDLERKGVQSHQGRLYARFIGLGNGNLEALHDRSYGFFRRQIILKVKPRDPNRVDDPYLGERLAEEKNDIFFWCLVGLNRLLENNFQFTVSEKAKNNWEEVVQESNNMESFLRSEGYIGFMDGATATSRRLYDAYCAWCDDNVCKPFGSKSFYNYLGANAHRFGLHPTNNIHIGGGRKARGFVGVRVL